MKLKLLLGITLPLIVVILLVVLSTNNVGLSVETETSDFVNLRDLKMYTKQDRLPVQKMNITNDYFLPRKYILPRMAACLNDKEGHKSMKELKIMYSEGTYTEESIAPIFSDIFMEYEIGEGNAVDLSPRSKKHIKLYVKTHVSTWESFTFEGYDELLLIDIGDSPDGSFYWYRICDRIESKELAKAVRLPIVNLDMKGEELETIPRLRDTMEENVIKTYTLDGMDYEVKVVDIDLNSKQAILNVNGMDIELEEGSNTDVMGIVTVGIENIYELEGDAVVEFYLD